MEGLSNEVRLNFGDAAKLATNFSSAEKSLRNMRRDMQGLGREAATANRMAMQATDAQRRAMVGATAAGAAFFYRATSLANPAAMERFTLAVNDATAVIGHKMIPALEWMTRRIRALGDWLASHPQTSTALGYGATGLALAGAGLAAYSLGKLGVRAARGAAADIGGALGYPSARAAGGAAGEKAAGAAAGGGRFGGGGSGGGAGGGGAGRSATPM